MIMEIKAKIRDKITKVRSFLGWNCIRIDYNAKKQKLKIPQTFEDRALKTTEMFMKAFEYAKPSIKKNVRYLINCEDFPERTISNRIMFSYSKNDREANNIVLIPDFVFHNWKESGLADYDQCCVDMLEASKKKPKYNTLFWIGNTKTHDTRGKLCSLAEVDNRIEAYGMDWKYENGKACPTRFVSLVDHTQYKYLIDVQGRGYSGRTKILMFSGRPLFIAERKWKEFWYKDLVPFEHYIPVKEDLSDLIERLDWAEANPEKCKEIAYNAQSFAKSNLTTEAALQYFTDILISCSNNE